MNKKVVAVGAALAGVVAAATAGSSATANSADPLATPYQNAASANAESGDVRPAAIPGIVAAATVAARGFTAARAPQQVAQVARAASFPQGLGLLGGAARTRSVGPGSAAEVIFD